MAEKMKVPFGTISIPDQSKKWIMDILESKRVSSGKFVHRFEEKFCELHGVKEAVALSSGTDADVLALAVLHDFGAKRGDEIIIPALSFVATGNAVFHAGFTPVFVDIERDSLNIRSRPDRKRHNGQDQGDHAGPPDGQAGGDGHNQFDCPASRAARHRGCCRSPRSLFTKANRSGGCRTWPPSACMSPISSPRWRAAW